MKEMKTKPKRESTAAFPGASSKLWKRAGCAWKAFPARAGQGWLVGPRIPLTSGESPVGEAKGGDALLMFAP